VEDDAGHAEGLDGEVDSDGSDGASGQWRDFAVLLRGHRPHFVAMGIVLSLSAALPLVGPLLLRAFVDRAIAGAPADDLVPLAVAYVVLAVVAQLLTVGVVYASTALVWRVTNDLRVRLTRHVLGLELAFHQSHSPGGLAERVDGDLTAVADYLATFVVRVLSALLTVLGAVMVLAVIDWRLGLVFLLYAIAAVLTFVQIRDTGVSGAADERGAQSQLLGGIEEDLVGQEDLRTNGAGGYALGRFRRDAAGVLTATIGLERALLRLWHVATGTVVGGAIVALVTGTLAFRAGWITLGTAFLMFQYTQILQQPFEEMIEQLQEVQKASGGMHRVGLLLSRHREDRPRGDAPFPSTRPALVFREVRVEYGSGAERQAVLHGVDLEIPAGQSLGLMGRTGSGKTTIKRLATGLLAPTSGRVTLAGADVWSIAPEELSRHLGVVPQEVRLFAASLRQNVTLFASGIPDARVVEVIERVGLADRLLGRPGALDVELHSDGTGLSAGEAQLLALARVFLREPELVVLDEATARIDPETEARLEQVIADVLRDRTSLVIAHRVSTLAHMDRLAVLDDGRVVEHGTRAELLADPGVYARLEALAASDEVVS
jgi:ABC-type multidrug transport system fused ATPase/permease subunit